MKIHYSRDKHAKLTGALYEAMDAADAGDHAGAMEALGELGGLFNTELLLDLVMAEEDAERRPAGLARGLA